MNVANVDCVHFGEATRHLLSIDDNTYTVHRCRHPGHATTTAHACASCPDRAAGQPKQTPFFDAQCQPLHLGGLYRGATAFAMLAGPSLAAVDLKKLRKRGILTIGVNNSPIIFRPDIWVSGDAVRKFHSAIFQDSGILKFIPVEQLYQPLRRQLPDGTIDFWVDYDGKPVTPAQMPSVATIRRNQDFDPATWLTEQATLNWGNGYRRMKANGWPETKSVIFLVLGIAWRLGIRRLFLLGCDFRMSEHRPYAWGEAATARHAKSNATVYRHAAVLLAALRPKFDEAGFQVLNCTEGSALEAFSACKYEDAVAMATDGVPQDGELVGRGWY